MACGHHEYSRPHPALSAGPDLRPAWRRDRPLDSRELGRWSLVLSRSGYWRSLPLAGTPWPPPSSIRAKRIPQKRIRRRRESKSNAGPRCGAPLGSASRAWARSSSLSDDSRARGRQRDLLGPPPGRRRRFHFRSIRFGAAAIAASVSGATGSGRLGGAAAAGRRRHRGDAGARALVATPLMGAAAGRALGGTGNRQTGGTERSGLSYPVDLTRAESSCARGAPSQRRRSAERPTFNWSAERPAIRPTRWRRLGGASAISFLGRERSIDHAAAAGRALGGTGNRQTGGTERSGLSYPVDLTRAESSCARGAPSQRRRSAERPTFNWSAERPAIRPTRWRRLGGASAISFLGRERSIDHAAAAGRALGGTGNRQTGGTERSGLSYPVDLTRAESSCARGAPSQRRRSAERPTFNWSAERPAIRPTRWRRLGGASAISFLGRERSIDHAAAAGRALGGTGNRQTGGTERSGLSYPVDLTRAKSSCARGAPSQRRRSAERPTFNWSAERPAIRPTRWRRLGGASAISFLGRERSIDHAAAAGRALGGTGNRQTGGTERSGLSYPVDLTRAESSCARGAPSQRRRSAERPTFNWSAERPAIRPTRWRRLGGASAISFLGRERSIDHAAAAGRALGGTGNRQTGGTERSGLSYPVDLTRAESSCARGAPSQRRRSAERPTFNWSAERPAIRPTRWRRLGGASAISFLGRERSIDHAAAAGRALGGTGNRQTGGTERSGLSYPVDLTRAESSCARGAPSQRRRSAERPTFNWSAERPAIRPTRWRRLGGASAISFLGRERSIDHAAAAGRALGGTGNRQTGGTERSGLSYPVDLTRAESSCARGAPSQRRRSAERPTFNWSAERPAIRPTRWRRLGGASAISFLGRERSIDHAAAAGRALGGTGNRQTGGTERSGLSYPVDLTRAESSCARGAPSQRRRSAERPTFNWSAERPAIRPTRWRRLGGASAISFLGRERSIDHAAAAGRALGGTGNRQTGGTERSGLSYPVDLTRAESSCARGAPSQRRRSAERPTFNWSAERPAIRPTRWRRLGGASAISFLGRERSIDHAAAAGRALGGTGNRQTGGTERSGLSYPVDLTRAESSCARGAPSQRRRSAERPTFNWSAERPAIRPTRWRRLGGASAISFLGRERSIDHAAAAGRALGGTGNRQTGGTERSGLSYPVDLTRAESSCARGAPSQRRRSAERPTFNWSAERPAIRPTRWRRLGGASAISFLGRERSIDHAAAAGRALGGTGNRQTGGTERSGLSYPVDLTRAESSCARGAPSQRRRSAERPTFNWSAERPAIRPTRWRRLGGASAISFLGRERSIDHAAAAGRALGGTGNRQTGGTERSGLSYPVDLTRAESSCARGAPSQRRRSAERPTFNWSAERPAIRPTRWRRLGGASAISFLGRERSIDHAAAAGRALDLSNNRKQGDC